MLKNAIASRREQQLAQDATVIPAVKAAASTLLVNTNVDLFGDFRTSADPRSISETRSAWRLTGNLSVDYSPEFTIKTRC
jgi:hypothetical protein